VEQNPPTNLTRSDREPTWAEFDAVVAERDAVIADLMSQLTAVLGRVAELEAQVKQNSGNSSKPPSSDAPYRKPFRANKPTGKKPGGQDGHEGKTNTPFAADAVTTEAVVPTNCGHCGDDFVADAPNHGSPFVFQHIELPAMPPLVIEYQLHERCCASCGGVTRGRLPGDVGPSPYGPRLQALVVTWAIQFHLSRRQIQRLLLSLYGLTICTGTIQGIIERVAAACEPPVADLKAAIGKAPFANADETGHMHQGGGAKGKRHWLWVAVTLWGAVFAAATDRGQAGLELVLGKDFAGIVGCDRWRPYESVFGKNRQLCWAHLKREGQAAVDQAEIMVKSKDAAVRFDGERLLAWGHAFLSEVKAMFDSWHRFQVGEYGRAGLRGGMVSHQTAFTELFFEGMNVARKKVRSMCKDLLRPVQWAALWQFVTVPGVGPTNNAAEQALRQPVLLRRKSNGTRSQTGMDALATLLSVVETCRRQGRSAIDYIEAVIRSHRLEKRPPSLVPA
jgi:transposase